MKRFFPLPVVFALFCFSFLTVALRLSLVKTTYSLGQSAKVLNNLKIESERLDLKLSQLRSPRHLEALAKQKFKLHPPTADKIIILKDDP